MSWEGRGGLWECEEQVTAVGCEQLNDAYEMFYGVHRVSICSSDKVLEDNYRCEDLVISWRLERYLATIIGWILCAVIGTTTRLFIWTREGLA